MKRFGAWSVLVMTGILSAGCGARNVNNQGMGYALVLGTHGEFLELKLINKSDHVLTSGGLFLSSARGGAGYYLSILDSNGRKYFQCAMIEQVEPGIGRIPPHGYLKKEISLDSLKKEYCLKPGIYSVQGTFAVPRRSESPQIVAESTPISVTVN